MPLHGHALSIRRPLRRNSELDSCSSGPETRPGWVAQATSDIAQTFSAGWGSSLNEEQLEGKSGGLRSQHDGSGRPLLTPVKHSARWAQPARRSSGCDIAPARFPARGRGFASASLIPWLAAHAPVLTRARSPVCPIRGHSRYVLIPL